MKKHIHEYSKIMGIDEYCIGCHEYKIHIEELETIGRHCESCASWGDCPCGNSKCRFKRKI